MKNLFIQLRPWDQHYRANRVPITHQQWRLCYVMQVKVFTNGRSARLYDTYMSVALTLAQAGHFS